MLPMGAVATRGRFGLQFSSLSYNFRDFAGALEERMLKRRRATVLAAKDGLFLLVQEQGQSHYSLPGGGIERNEPSLLPAVREVH